MGTNLPSPNHDALEWLEGHIAQWAANAGGIGVASAVVTDLATAIVNTRTAFVSTETIRSDSKTATSNFHTVADGMRAEAAPVVANIKNFAENSADPQAVYTLAGITPADPPSPALPPEQPGNLSATLNGDGSVTIEWDGRGPTGTVYILRRKLATETAFTQIGQGDSRVKSFTDFTVPSGIASALYTVQGVRGSDASPVSPALTVLFGSADAEAGEMGLAA
ncbi:MAG: fibronectin type III domain-containing protein [Planctomycetes bacterium]|nr:fibronectin type III domain-containing protein [Planctomycetota bacterium]